MLTKLYNDLKAKQSKGLAQTVKVEYFENVKLVTMLYEEKFYLFKIFQDEVHTVRRIS